MEEESVIITTAHACQVTTQQLIVSILYFAIPHYKNLWPGFLGQVTYIASELDLNFYSEDRWQYKKSGQLEWSGGYICIWMELTLFQGSLT